MVTEAYHWRAQSRYTQRMAEVIRSSCNSSLTEACAVWSARNLHVDPQQMCDFAIALNVSDADPSSSPLLAARSSCTSLEIARDDARFQIVRSLELGGRRTRSGTVPAPVRAWSSAPTSRWERRSATSSTKQDSRWPRRHRCGSSLRLRARLTRRAWRLQLQTRRCRVTALFSGSTATAASRGRASATRWAMPRRFGNPPG